MLAAASAAPRALAVHREHASATLGSHRALQSADEFNHCEWRDDLSLIHI